MMVTPFQLELVYMENFKAATFEIMAQTHDEALNFVLAALEAAGAENLRRETRVFEKPLLLRPRQGE
jgi:hypothetical protein